MCLSEEQFSEQHIKKLKKLRTIRKVTHSESGVPDIAMKVSEDISTSITTKLSFLNKLEWQEVQTFDISLYSVSM